MAYNRFNTLKAFEKELVKYSNITNRYFGNIGISTIFNLRRISINRIYFMLYTPT